MKEENKIICISDLHIGACAVLPSIPRERLEGSVVILGGDHFAESVGRLKKIATSRTTGEEQ